MNIIFEILDKSKRRIYLTKERWAHIQKHPEMSNQIENIKDTLINPFTIRNSHHDEQVKFYYKYYKNRKSKAKYLLVSVKYLNGDGFVITSFYTNKTKGEK